MYLNCIWVKVESFGDREFIIVVQPILGFMVETA